MTTFCDNEDCILHDEQGLCGCDKMGESNRRLMSLVRRMSGYIEDCESHSEDERETEREIINREMCELGIRVGDSA
jgi:hypothetical protein